MTEQPDTPRDSPEAEETSAGVRRILDEAREREVLALFRDWSMEEAVELARGLPQDRLLVVADSLLWEDHPECAQNIVDEILGENATSDLLVRIGNAYWRQGRFTEAQRFHWRALNLLPHAEREQLRYHLDARGMSDEKVRRNRARMLSGL